MTKLELHVENVHADSIPNLARFAHYIGVVAQINGSLIEEVVINGGHNRGPETTSPDGKLLTLGAHALPPMHSAKPSAIAAWCGAALHGFAHSRYSPRTTEPLRATLAQRKLHRTWNMIEDARIERLLLREFPGWQPHLMGAVNHILLTPRGRHHKPDLVGVFPLLVGRTYLPAALRQESYEAFAAEHSYYIADAVQALVTEYLTVVDPGSEDHDVTVDIVTRLHALIGDVGSDCGSHEVADNDDANREWTDPGDPEDDDPEDEVDADADADDDGNHEVTDDDDADDGDDGEAGDDDADDGDDGDGEAGDGADDGDDGDDDGEAGDDGDDGETGDEDGEAGTGFDGDDEGGTEDDGEGDGDGVGEGDDTDQAGEGVGTDPDAGSVTSRLAEWSEAIDSALAQDERLNDVAEAVTTGPMPTIRLNQRPVTAEKVPLDVQQAEQDIARELRVLMDGARPGMRRRIDRGRFNIARVVREGGTTRPQEMFDRHDPGALRSTGCAVAVLADVSGSMSGQQSAGAMASVWSIDRAVQSVRGAFKAWTFGTDSHELPSSLGDAVWMPNRLDGSTNPIVGLSSAQAWLSQQREPNKLCVVATDGAWNQTLACNEVLESMVASGVQVVVFGIDTDVSHRFHSERTGIMTAHVRSAADIGPAIGALLVNRVRKSLHR